MEIGRIFEPSLHHPENPNRSIGEEKMLDTTIFMRRSDIGPRLQVLWTATRVSISPYTHTPLRMLRRAQENINVEVGNAGLGSGVLGFLLNAVWISVCGGGEDHGC